MASTSSRLRLATTIRIWPQLYDFFEQFKFTTNGRRAAETIIQTVAQEPETFIDIPALDSEEGKAQLVLSTFKSRGGEIISAVSIHFLRNGMITFQPFSDFHKTLLRTRARATQRALDAQHASVFTAPAVEALKAETLAFYAEKRKK
jgi:hypothetical protein